MEFQLKITRRNINACVAHNSSSVHEHHLLKCDTRTCTLLTSIPFPFDLAVEFKTNVIKCL